MSLGEMAPGTIADAVATANAVIATHEEGPSTRHTPYASLMVSIV